MSNTSVNPLKRILVTGGAGFIGSHTVEWLLNANKDVVVLDNLSSGSLANLDLTHPRIEFIEGNILEYPFVEELLSSCDGVIHLAAIASVPMSIENPIYTFQINTQGFLHILQAVHQNRRPTRVVYASSAAVYGDEKQLPCDDTKKLNAPPLSPYALQKIQAEEYAKLYASLHGIQSLGLRYFNVYGPRQDPASPYSGVISRFLNAYKNHETLTIYGDGQQSRDFIHVRDVARANLLALESDFCGVVNIATGKPQTLLNVVQAFEEAGRTPASLQFNEPRVGDIKSSFAATAKAREHIGFSPEISLVTGLKELLSTA